MVMTQSLISVSAASQLLLKNSGHQFYTAKRKPSTYDNYCLNLNKQGGRLGDKFH